MNKRLYAECGKELLTGRVATNFTKIINTHTNSSNLQHPLSNCFKRTTLQLKQLKILPTPTPHIYSEI